METVGDGLPQYRIGGIVMNTIAIIGSCDTKYREIAYMREQVESQGMKAMVINGGHRPQSVLWIRCFQGRCHQSKKQGQEWAELEPRTKAKRLHL